ncbi:hypothetical protein CN514_24535 [Bacillus sp. AFS001701]|uniref:hypothetical protein n=1 Tax=Bacillus sp. AFS001701 TaxID=2033480 RepID=UPI000BFAB9D8|nr:hypothetical protein [Bacillus sp. AFS001701]PET36677.1 hypothetical protein CN514_24535 [Bacillus sp. AFS001701]
MKYLFNLNKNKEHFSLQRIVEIIAFLFVDFSLTWIERVMTILFLTFMYKAGKAATTKKETAN